MFVLFSGFITADELRCSGSGSRGETDLDIFQSHKRLIDDYKSFTTSSVTPSTCGSPSTSTTNLPRAKQ